ncbi:hypothetical protein [Hymenobacter sublimis]|uniref:Lipocalin-like domain-containing protein n=1 Tax=Hymenobacter sublimis TaxID=2933777 RepID=A0ABY4J9Q0_9BACT|nr:hypothetical protein [Hymenobacter sublimis]UPL48527.1 hypothetical protein MWH26_15205 [Hymenobacter sublimis]
MAFIFYNCTELITVLMKRKLPLLLLASLTLVSCEEFKHKLFSDTIEGIYHSADNQQVEITASKVIMTDVGKDKVKTPPLTFDYKHEGNHIFLENRSNVGGLQSMIMSVTNIEFQVIDDNTVKMVSTGLLGGKTNTFKRVAQQ